MYNRGVEKRVIYNDENDYSRFIDLLYLCNTNESINVRNVRRMNKSIFDFERGKTLVSIGAYCLMPNHFHLLVTPNTENGVSDFMSKLGTSYSMYFNKKNERTGSLCETRYKSKHVDSDNYLKYLYSYIHLNPVKLVQSDWRENGIKDLEKTFNYVNDYKYSSLQDYLGTDREAKNILNRDVFPDYFGEESTVKKEIFEWLSFSPDLGRT